VKALHGYVWLDTPWKCGTSVEHELEFTTEPT
jgi:hypothetical protein